MCAASEIEDRRDSYDCAQGRPAAFQPSTAPRFCLSSSGPSKPCAILKQSSCPAWVKATAAARERTPERHRNSSGVFAETPARAQNFQKARRKIRRDLHRRKFLPFDEDRFLVDGGQIRHADIGPFRLGANVHQDRRICRAPAWNKRRRRICRRHSRSTIGQTWPLLPQPALWLICYRLMKTLSENARRFRPRIVSVTYKFQRNCR